MSSLGPYSENSIVVGDCGNHLHEIPDESITAVLCDPPYGLSKNPDMAEVLRCWMNDEEYAEIARARIAYWQDRIEADRAKRPQLEMTL